MHSTFIITALCTLWPLYPAKGDADFTQYVNVFQGSSGGGNRFPGVVASPFAMVKLGPDVQTGKRDAYSGYSPDGNIWGFSMMHESGTGGAPKYGVVSQMPVVGNVSNPLADLSHDRSAPDEAQVGYYKSSLSNGITVELAASEHSGLFNYTFPSSAGPASLVVDISHVLPSFRGLGWEQHYAGGNFTFFSDGHYEGSGTYNNGWNLSPDWNRHVRSECAEEHALDFSALFYYCGRFSQLPTTSKTFKGTGTRLKSYDTTSSVSGTERLGGVFAFATTSVQSRVGISFISARQACDNVDREITPATTLESLEQRAKFQWNKVLSTVQVASENGTDLQLLYSSMYGMFLIPSNRTGENPNWTSKEPYYDDIFTLWDLHRCHTSLFHILHPVAYEEFVRSLIDIWRHEGFMPDARSSNFNGRVQGGSNADNVLADAYVKGVHGAINWEDGFSAMRTDAEEVPANNNDPMSPDHASTKEGRGALPDWLQYGYITPNYTRAVSRAIEYSANDFSLYQVAKGLGKMAEAEKYLDRSRNWRNHWDPKASANGHSGFVVPRLANGSFVPQDPMSCGGCYWGDAYYEDNPWVYSLNALHDVATLNEYMGGDVQFVDRINKLFDLGIFKAGNEPSFASPFLYNFVKGQQHLSVQRSREIGKLYNGGDKGLPGNSDAGAMESNIMWQQIGLWPMVGQTTFLILSPWFPQLTIALGHGKSLHVTATGGNRDTAFYVQSVQVNGEQWTRAWVTWDDIFANGGTMDFVLGPSPAPWATGDAPPSPAYGAGHARGPPKPNVGKKM